MRKRFVHSSTTYSPLKRFVTIALMVPLCALFTTSKTPTLLEKIKASGQLQVISRNGPTTFYEGPEGLTGFEYTLAKAFADQLGVKLVIHNENNLGHLLDSIGTDQADFAASGLTITEKRERHVRFSAPYLDVTQQLLYQKGSTRPDGVEQLIGKDLLVIANSAHAERLRELQQEYPALTWREADDLEMIDLVEMVHSGTVEYAIVDSNAYAMNRSVYPKAQAAFDISAPQQLAWAFPKGPDISLYNVAQEFFEQIEDDGRLLAIHDQFYDHVDDVKHSGALLFASRIESRLPRWEPLLREAGQAENIDWRLLAAISYQESHWNSRAQSHTGVRGLMMLTQATAKDMGIDDRVDPTQSISGGAKYYKNIFERISNRIQGEDRTWMALAAYNVGFGHLEDARILAQKDGANPDKWADVKEYLPLLSKRKYYQNTKHGYARGWEPVEYVQNIRNFYNILSWHDHMETRRLAAAEAGEEQNQDFQAVEANAEDKVSLSL